MERHLITLAEIDGGIHEDERAVIATQLGDGAAVGAPAEGGMLEVSLNAESREEALARVRDAIAAAGIEERVTFPSTTGTDFHPPGRRAAPPEESPDDSDREPPHLQGGSPHEDEPAPYDPPPKDVP